MPTITCPRCGAHVAAGDDGTPSRHPEQDRLHRHRPNAVPGLHRHRRPAMTTTAARARARRLTAEPVGLAEIAQRLGVERATAKQWNARGLLPEPRWTVSGSPAWDWTDVEAWARETGRLEGSS